MSTRTTLSLVSGVAISREAIRLWGALLLAALGAVVAARISTIGFIAMAGILLVVFAYVSFRAPRAMLVLMILAPLVDRYVVRQTVPDSLQRYGNALSEGLLVIVAVAILVHGRRSGRLVPAIRHPMTALMAAFVVVAAVSTVINHVSVETASLGTLFTVDAFVLFFLARVIGFDKKAAAIAAVAFVSVAVVAGLLAIGQVVLTPNFLGLTTWSGRFGEGLRPGSIFIGQPNMLGAVVALALPFAAFAVARPELGNRWRALALVAALILGISLVYTFSRGTWLAIAVAVALVGLVVDRRAFVTTAVIGAAALALAIALPRGILLPANSQWSVDLGNATFGRIDAIASGRDLRLKFIQNGLPILQDHPVVGSGPGTYGGGVAADIGSPLYSRYTDGVVPTGRTVDNYWLHVFVEFGIVGGILLLGMLGWAVIEMLKAVRGSTGPRRVLLAAIAAATVLLAVDSGTEMLLEGNTTSFALWLFVGVGSLLAAPLVARTLERDDRLEPATQEAGASIDALQPDPVVEPLGTGS
jgi:O-antigen ligase